MEHVWDADGMFFGHVWDVLNKVFRTCGRTIGDYGGMFCFGRFLEIKQHMGVSVNRKTYGNIITYTKHAVNHRETHGDIGNPSNSTRPSGFPLYAL